MFEEHSPLLNSYKLNVDFMNRFNVDCCIFPHGGFISVGRVDNNCNCVDFK